jgi:diketogulonate reductase-like aldo/keto reductase/predicted kinase
MRRVAWLDCAELRIGLGCLRLPADEEAARDTIAAAASSGITVFDSARAYGVEPGESERLLARVLRDLDPEGRTRIVTKGGMARPAGGWMADGRAKTIAADCEASLAALDGRPIDLYLLHTPDPRTPWQTSVRALAHLADEGLVRHVGVANVNRTQLDEALELAPIAAVQVALSPTIVPIPGATRPASARSSARAATLKLDDLERAALNATFGGGPRARRPVIASPADGEVVIVMGVPGAGKSRIAAEYVDDGYVRLNRDQRGGSLRALAAELGDQLDAGVRRAVLDNTYLTRDARSHVIDAAARHALAMRCVWVDTPLAQAQHNLVLRLLERFGSLPTPEQIRAAAKREPWLMLPTSQMRALRELEPPSADEGFAAIEHVSFTRAPASAETTGAVFVAAAALTCDGIVEALARAEPTAPHLLFDWVPDGNAGALHDHAARIRDLVTGPVEVAVCPHAAGPPRCWCRPPLPGLPLAFARAHSVDPARATLIGSTPAHRTLARTLGSRYVSAGERDGFAEADPSRRAS